MRLIKPSFEIIKQQPGEVGMLKHIETCGRVAWKSEDKTTDDSYIKFIDMLKGVNHGSVLEHGTIYLRGKFLNKYGVNKYSRFYQKMIEGELIDFVTTNYRVLIENGWLDDLQYQCEPTEYHEKRVTVRFVMDRIGSQSFVRHRVFSFTQESTRYCNYSKDKFDNEITCIKPLWSSLQEDNYKINSIGQIDNIDTSYSRDNFILAHSLCTAENYYFNLLEAGWKPQQARTVLPNSLKTELIMTGFISDWKHFFMLRTAKGAHPQAQELAIPLEQEFKKLKLL